MRPRRPVRHPERLSSSAPAGSSPSTIIPMRLQIRLAEKAEAPRRSTISDVDRLRRESSETSPEAGGPDSCIDAVGLEAHGHTIGNPPTTAPRPPIDASTTDRIHTPSARRSWPAARAAPSPCPGVYGGLPDKFPLGAAFSKGLTLKMGQTHVHRYLKPLLERIQRGRDRPHRHHHPPDWTSRRTPPRAIRHLPSAIRTPA